MNKFQLNITASQAPTSKVLDLNRRFVAAKIDSSEFDTFREIIKFNNSLRALEIIECVLNKQQLVKALGHLHLLKEFTAGGVSFTESAEKSIVPVQLKHLKNVKLCHSDNSILSLLSTSALKFFSIRNVFRPQQDIKHMMELLAKQSALECLHIGEVTEEFLSNDGIVNLPFKLKILEISRVNLRNHHEQLVRFLTIHQPSLKQLSLNSFMSEATQKFVLQNMTGLTELHIATSLSSPSKIEPFFKDIQPLVNIKRLKCIGSFKSNSQAKHILALFPSLEVFDIKLLSSSHWPTDFLVATAAKYPQLQQLHIPEISTFRMLERVKFTKLKEFHVAGIGDDAIYNDFIKRHSETLEKISVGWIDGAKFTRSLTIDAITSCKKLTHISFSSDSPIVTRMFSKISRPHPWTLESKLKFMKGSNTKWIRLKFYFPDDLGVWHERCTSWDDELIRDFGTADNYGLNAFINKFK